MKKNYLLTLITALISLCAAWTPATGQTAYAGLQSTGSTGTWSAGNDDKFCMIGFDVNTPKKVAEVAFKGTSTTNFQIAGCLADEVYYSVMSDTKSGDVTLHSLNCETQNDIEIASTSSVADMTYDATAKKMYAITNTNESSDATTTLYELNVKDGTLTSLSTFTSKGYFAIAAKDGKLYLAREEQKSEESTSYYLYVDTYDPATGDVTEGEQIESVKNRGTYNSMDFNESKLYIMMGQRIVIVDLEAKTATIVTAASVLDPSSTTDATTPRPYTGICFAKSTEDPEEEAKDITIYAGINSTGYVNWTAGNGYNFCMVGVSTSDLSAVTEVPFKGDSNTNFEMAGCLAGNVYYAVMQDKDTEETTLHTLNCTTGNDVTIGSTENVSDMTYDAQSQKVYAVYNGYEDDYVTYVYEVNTSNGALTEVTKIEGSQHYGIAAKDGLLYLASSAYDASCRNWLSISTYNIATGEIDSTSYKKIATVGYSGTTNCMEFNGDDLYLMLGRKLYAIDLTAKTAEKFETTFPKDFAGLCFAKSSEDGTAGGDVTPEPQPEDTRLVSVVEFYGSNDGEWSGLSRKEVTFYDKNNNPTRKATYGAVIDYVNQTIDSLEIERYYVNEYNESGEQLLTSFSQQYGEGRDGADKGFSAARDSVEYEYNADGLLTKKTDKGQSTVTTYEYTDGVLTLESNYLQSNLSTPMTTVTYSNFNEAGLPQTITGGGQYTYQKYEDTIEYNAAGQKTSRVRNGYTDVWNDETNEFDVVESPSESEVWTYDESGMLLTDSIAKTGYDEWGSPTGILEASSKTVYSYDGENTNRIVCKTYSPNVNEETGVFSWVENLTYSITEKKEYAPALATELSVEAVEGEINTQKLSFSVPEEALIGGYVFDVYRHGIKIARVQLSDEGAYDEETGKAIYTDAETKNGTYDYFVQTVMVDELDDEENPLNISNVVNYTAQVDLPAPTNVRATGKTVTADGTTVTIEWDAPENAANYGFQRYNVIYTTSKVADNAEDEGQDTKWTTDFYEWNNKLYIQAVYKYGKANSDTLTIDISDVTAINDVSTANGAAMSYANSTLSLSTPADVTVFAANGATVAQSKGATSLSLSNLPKGTYVVTAKVNGKLQVAKIVR